MNDFRDLKAIAEACHQHQPLRFMRSHGALYIRNDNGIVFDVHQNRSFPELMTQNKDYADLVLAASPVVVLALIAENERLEADHDLLMSNALPREFIKMRADYDQLKAENEALRKTLVGLLDLYDTDEGCRTLPQYIAGRAAMGNGEQS
ncbi:hypothetical protein PHLH7_26040 [Pseudomonas sp. Ost2]|uniref:hypothetical protein n=1 Tax=Pseudomonas sp. Ost2 TaxID=2678260 RepID=UPI001BB34211|nr:hypothetical protein [Pseudomonas sp. Ost2]BBP76500.1 hypothetical protein PHLH7_26040 [Pseudomonas sp. Ost2]